MSAQVSVANGDRFIRIATFRRLMCRVPARVRDTISNRFAEDMASLNARAAAGPREAVVAPSQPGSTADVMRRCVPVGPR